MSQAPPRTHAASDGEASSQAPTPHEPPPEGSFPTPAPKHDPYASLRYPFFLRYMLGNFFFTMGRHALTLAIGWQVYEWTNSAAALGFIGFVNVLPLFALVFPAGVLSDRVDRRQIILVTMAVSCVLSILLALCTYFHEAIPSHALLLAANSLLKDAAAFFSSADAQSALHFDNPAIPIIFLLQLLQSTVRVISGPARTTIIPLLVPPDKINNAFIWNSSAFELSAVLGAGVGGFVLLYSYTLIYAFDAIFAACLAFILLGVKTRQVTAAHAGTNAPGALAGVVFIWKQKAVLGAITLDLFAVLFGGVVALFPIYAEEVLEAGSGGFGALRAAPTLGAVTMAILIAHMRPFRRPGITLLWYVAGFGLSLLIFALSRNIFLSIVALFLSGMCDNVSVVIRHTLVQMLTPDNLRGRVTSVNQLFIGSSNEISELRGGLMAARFGAVTSGTIGALCTMLVVLGVAALIPALRRVPPLSELKPAGEDNGKSTT
ncbi:MAG: MFS transporter [Puniceicoccales bacterium]|jgi:MFS family permease|nr:MFS transporter [Puniceicoccales bacterium]